MKKIIFLATQELDERNFYRFGINILNEDFDVEYWDLRSIFQKINFNKNKSYKIYRSFNSYYELFKQILSIKDKFYFIDFLAYINFPLFIAKKILKFKGGLNLHINVGPTIENSKRLKKNVSDLFRKIKIKNFFLSAISFRYKSILRKILKIDHDFFFIGGHVDLEKFDKRKLIFSHNLDYNIFLDLKKKKVSIKDDYIVFLDQNLPNHPDYSLLNLPNFIDESYYDNLKKFLNLLEKTLEKKIVFCVHPRTHKEADYLKKFDRLEFEKTAEKIQSSYMVVGHDSLALNFGILFKKPLLVIKTPEMKLSNKSSNIEYFSKEIDCNICDIDETDLNFLKVTPKININRYDEYIKKYIKYKGEEINSWKIVKNFINDN